MTGAIQATMLPDGRRLHLQHGPIDLVIEAIGDRDEIASAYRQARDRFADVLAVLVEELAMLRRPVGEPRWMPAGPVARRMMAAVWPHRSVFVTPMAAVAGSVADEILAAMVHGTAVTKAYVNNSGDIAVYLTPGQRLRLGIVGEIASPSIEGLAELTYDRPVRGVATSGWKGRSWSLGIADAVTVLAESAAAADVAATLVANAVTVDHPSVDRAPATELDDQTDLGDRLVTVGVGDLDAAAIDEALGAGMERARTMCDAGLIAGAVLILKNETRAVGAIPAALPAQA